MTSIDKEAEKWSDRQTKGCIVTANTKAENRARPSDRHRKRQRQRKEGYNREIGR